MKDDNYRKDLPMKNILGKIERVLMYVNPYLIDIVQGK